LLNVTRRIEAFSTASIVARLSSAGGTTVQLINTEGLIVIGPGSEWFWSAVSGLILAGTFIALYRQLRLQANASATDQLTEFEREWASERMLRFKLAILLELRAGVNPANLSPGAAQFMFNFWERLGALARGGRINPKILASVNGGVGEWWWAILKEYVFARRVERGPAFGEAFEWLSGVSSKLNRESGIYNDDKIGDLDVDIASLEGRIRVEEALRTAPGTPPPVSKRRAAAAQGAAAD
jgi:hypothetical protein